MVDAGMSPVAVYTQPDRPSGRGRRLTPSPVKVYAEAQGLPVLQPTTLKDADAQRELADLAPDMLVVAAYGLLLPQAVLDIPRHGCLNVHASLLPRWRGAAPIQASILAGDEETGICLMGMEVGLDTGPVFARAAVPITSTTTAGSLHDELAALGGALLADQLPAILAGEVAAEPQDDELATYAPKIRPSDAEIDWHLSAADVSRRIRAYNPVPGARFRHGDEVVKAWSATEGPRATADATPGQVMAASADGIEVACGSGSVLLQQLQRPGRKRVSAAEFADQLGVEPPVFG